MLTVAQQRGSAAKKKTQVKKAPRHHIQRRPAACLATVGTVACTTGLRLRKRLHWKQPDPLLKARKLEESAHSSRQHIAINTDGLEVATIADVSSFGETGIGHTSEAEECSSGVSSAQLALTLLMTTMAAAQAEASKSGHESHRHDNSCSSAGRMPWTPSVPKVILAASPPQPQTKGTSTSSISKARNSSSASSSSGLSSSSSGSDASTAKAQPSIRAVASPVRHGFTTEQRMECTAKLRDVILGRLPTWQCQPGDGLPSHEKITEVAREIADEFSCQWTKMKNPRGQLRTLLSNLRDLHNPDFVRLVTERQIPPQKLPMLTSDEMASTAKQSERTELRERHLHESTLHRGLSGMMDQEKLQAYKALISRK